jgi:hypothetical protein
VPIWRHRTPTLRKIAWVAGEVREFRNEGFYERFPAKGQIERVVRIQRELAKKAGVQSKGKAD